METAPAEETTAPAAETAAEWSQDEWDMWREAVRKL